MGNLKLVQSVIDDATITSSDDATGYEDDLVVDDRVAKKWYADAPTVGHWIKFDAGSGNTFAIDSIGVFGYGGLWVTNTQQRLLPYYSDNDSDWTAMDEMYLNDTLAQAVMYYSSTYTHRYFRLNFVGDGNPLTVQVGRVIMGLAVEPDPGAWFGMERPEPDPSLISESEGQQHYYKAKAHYKEWTAINVQYLTYASMAQIRDIWRDLGRCKGLMVGLDIAGSTTAFPAPNTEGVEATMFCRFLDDYRPNDFRYDLQTITLNFRELK